MIRLGEEPKGVVGSGWVTSPPFEAPHWDPEKAEAGEVTRYVELIFDRLEPEPLVSWERLQQAPFSAFKWGIRMSGLRIPPEIAEALEAVWQSETASTDIYAGEVPDQQSYPEGTLRRVYANAYERNPAVRARCIAHHGLDCSVCRMSFAKEYGAVAARLIHVHHLRPLAELRGRHEVDAIEDLRPVCPNCHGVIHLRTPPYTIKEAQELIRLARLA
ncbi:MAG: HNH endonuclease [Gemmatimonadota bacterium]|nr:HNH endonuclease [Gemmatimonadota bacterium]